jgi:hypothetical protein
MDEHVLGVFQSEVRRQCNFVRIALEDLGRALRRNDDDRIWFSIQAFLAAVANISKLLWPGQMKKVRIPERGPELRKNLEVPSISPLKERTFRNHFEHFDERLEKWATTSHARNMIESLLGPYASVQGVDPGDIMRHFDPAKQELVFRGELYEFKPVLAALNTLQGVVEAAIRSKRPTFPEPDAAHSFKDKNVWIAELAERSVRLSGLKFIRCRIRGPAIIFPSGCELIGCEVMSFGHPREAFFWNVPEDASVVGVIMLEDSVFESCEFLGIGFTGPPHIVNQLREGLHFR